MLRAGLRSGGQLDGIPHQVGHRRQVNPAQEYAMTTVDISNWRTPRAQVAALSRSRAATDPDLIEARRNLRAARLAEYVAKAIAEAPPLNKEQLEQIGALLRGGTNDAA